MEDSRTPLRPHEERLLQQLVDKLTGWDRLLGMGKPGVKQCRQHIRDELETYKTKLIRGY